jgi:hypothetical protein
MYNQPPAPELRAAPDGSIEIWIHGQQAGGIEPEPGGFRVILGDADPGASLTFVWVGDPVSLRFDLTGGAL